MNHKVRAQVVIKSAKFILESKAHWKSWKVTIDSKDYTITGRHPLPRSITIAVPPDMEFEPIVGDQVELVKLNHVWAKGVSWIPNLTPFNGVVDERMYKRNVSTKEEVDVDGTVEILYRYPHFAEVAYFEIKPVVCYYNPITGYQECHTVTSNKIMLDDHPDQLIWSIYERGHDGLLNVIGDWERASDAQRVHDWLTSTLRVMKILKR